MSSSGGGTEEGRATGLWEVDLIRLGDGLGRAVAREGQRPPARSRLRMLEGTMLRAEVGGE